MFKLLALILLYPLALALPLAAFVAIKSRRWVFLRSTIQIWLMGATTSVLTFAGTMVYNVSRDVSDDVSPWLFLLAVAVVEIFTAWSLAPPVQQAHDTTSTRNLQ